MKSSSLTFIFFLFSLFCLTSLTLRAESFSEQTVSRENYRECLQSVASQEDSYGLYGANMMAEGIIQTSATDGSYCYNIADATNPDAPIHGLTKLQQEHYCTWSQNQKQNEGTCCYLKNEAEDNTLPENQETVIIITPHDASGENYISPLMMFEESGKNKEEESATQQNRTDRDRTSAAQDLSSLQQRDAQPANIKETDNVSVMSDLTDHDSTKAPSYHPDLNQLKQEITAARYQAFTATQELLQHKTFFQSQQQQIEALWNSYRNIQKTLTSAYTLRNCLKKSNAGQLQAYQQIVHGICQEAELAYNDAQQKLKTFRQLPGCTSAANTFIEQAYANFSEAQKKLHELKQQHEQVLSADADSTSSTLVEAYENRNPPLKITAPSSSKITKPTAEEQEALLLEQFLREHQWYGVRRRGKKVTLPASLPQEEHEVQILLEEKTPQKLFPPTLPSALLQKTTSAENTLTPTDHNIPPVDHQSFEEQTHQEHSEIPPTIDSDHNDGETKAAAITPSPSKRKPQKKKKAASEASSTSQPPEKSEADWEEEVKKKFPLHSFDLAKEDYHQFQENAARLTKSLVEDPAYSYLFENITASAREGMKNLQKHDYCIDGTESNAVLALKKFIIPKINEEYYPRYLANKITFAKRQAQGDTERLNRAEEARKKFLAELEQEEKAMKEAQQSSATGKSKGKKK